MDVIKRASYASKQVRAGPAPLASFEDLPSDELESPEDISSDMPSSAILDDTSSQFTTPDSFTMSSHSRFGSDLDSDCTITPGDIYDGQSSEYTLTPSCDEGQSMPELRTTSLSSLSKETTLTVKHKKGSAHSLGIVETVETDYSQRKSSWTDIFQSHNTNSAKPNTVQSSVGEKHSKKKNRSELQKKSSGDSKPKEKSKFLSIFKKKSSSNKISTSHSPAELIISNENLSDCAIQKIPPETVPVKISNGNAFKGKENELPLELELCPTKIEAQNDLGKVNSEKTNRIPDERKINRKLVNISEASFDKEYNILSKEDEKKMDAVSKTENIPTVVSAQDPAESESEILTEEKTPATVESDDKDEIEAETLISQDLSEMEEDSITEIQQISFDFSKHVKIPSRQQRLEVVTKPIERPRSTTPINAAPLEAFIQSVSPTFVSKIEKIKLSLPGDQFVGRAKSPKKSSVKSWTDFCQNVLHSPRMYQRTDSDDLPDPFSDGAYLPTDIPFSEGDSNWATFESSGFGDDFGSLESTSIAIKNLSKGKDDKESTFEFSPKCSCVCHVTVSSTDGCSDSWHEPSVRVPTQEKSLCICDCQLKSKPSSNHPFNLLSISDSTFQQKQE